MPTKGGRRRGINQVPLTRTGVATFPPEKFQRPKGQLERPYAPPEHLFRLVQRIETVPWTDTRLGIPGLELDYMGNSDFEFDTVPMSFKRIRGSGPLTRRSVGVAHLGVTRFVYFVGPLGGMDRKIADFKRWLDDGARSDELTYFPYVFTGDYGPILQPGDVQTAAWWSLEDDVLWTLDFKIALKLLALFV